MNLQVGSLVKVLPCKIGEPCILYPILAMIGNNYIVKEIMDPIVKVGPYNMKYWWFAKEFLELIHTEEPKITQHRVGTKCLKVT